MPSAGVFSLARYKGNAETRSEREGKSPASPVRGCAELQDSPRDHAY